MKLVPALFGLAVGVLIVVAYLRRRRALRDLVEQPRLSDEGVEEIIARGVVHLEDVEPLDPEEAARAEEEFWESEGWDPAEEERF